tara:strand:+ start:7302 stop:8054 length:753 start_codon:yes stop_codon:yes gene_type:complete
MIQISISNSVGGGGGNLSSGGSSFENLYSFAFDGNVDAINCGNVPTFNGVTNGSISAWFKSTSGGNFISKFLKTGTKQFLVQFLSTKIDVYGSGLGFRSTDTVTWLDGNWHHFALSYDASRVANQRFKVYIDKVPLTNLVGLNGPTSLASATNDLLIGDRDGIQVHWTGNIDEVALFTTSLDAAQVAALYDNGPTDLSGESGLVNWWRMGDKATFDAGTGNWTLVDQGSGGNNATTVSMPEASRQADVPT